MVAVQRTTAVPSPGRAPAFTPAGRILAIALIAMVAFLGAKAALETWPPVQAGWTTWVVGDAIPCNEADAEDGSNTCHLVPYAEGREVGIGFTVRNDAPIPMTIVAADVIRDGVLTPATLEPQRMSGDVISGLGTGMPFAPIEIAAGGEEGIQFVGTYGDCETVARDYSRGSGLAVGEAFLTLRWAFFETHATVPIGSTLALTAPDGCP